MSRRSLADEPRCCDPVPDDGPVLTVVAGLPRLPRTVVASGVAACGGQCQRGRDNDQKAVFHFANIDKILNFRKRDD